MPYKTTLTDEHGIVHAVTMPDIPADYPEGGTVVPLAACGVGENGALAVRLARQTAHPSFTNRVVTCCDCYSVRTNA